MIFCVWCKIFATSSTIIWSESQRKIIFLFMIFCFLCRNRQIVIFLIEIIFTFITTTTISIIIIITITITTTNIFYVCIMTMLMMLRLMMRKAGGESEKFVSCVEDGLIVSQVTIFRILMINADEHDDKHDHNCCRYFACPAPTGRMFLHKVKFFPFPSTSLHHSHFLFQLYTNSAKTRGPF